MSNQFNFSESLSAKDPNGQKHGLRGHVSVYRKNKTTGEVTLWDESDNIIPISGYQWILMKMFGLHLDSSHQKPEIINRDTNLIIPDLNGTAVLNIGTDPSEYSVMDEDISSKHIVQGFMIGNGGAGEDQMTAKNTDYSFIKLRNPIPFQQGTIPKEIIGKYCGRYRLSSASNSYFIKRFDGIPKIYHGWWKDGQRWDYVDPISQEDLGPNANNGSPKTSRIETYVDCQLTLDETDCQSYFNTDGNTQTPAINEIGLVAFDSTNTGTRSMLENLYESKIVPALCIIFNNDAEDDAIAYLKTLIPDIYNVLNADGIASITQTNFANFRTTINTIEQAIVDETELDFDTYQDELSSDDNIGVVAHYTKDGRFLMEEDQYLSILTDAAFDDTTVDEAQRIKLITYYTFKSIPIQTNWEILINYRIYAN